jgi:hypothetical protein
VIKFPRVIFSHARMESFATHQVKKNVLLFMNCFIDQKKVTLSEVQGTASFSELRDTAIKDYLDKLERESLIKKLKLILDLCGTPPAIEKYCYDQERIVVLDKLRHDYAHRGLGGRLPRGDDDLWFLRNTTDFLLLLVNQRYGIRLDPALCSLMCAGQPSEPAKA